MRTCFGEERGGWGEEREVYGGKSPAADRSPPPTPALGPPPFRRLVRLYSQWLDEDSSELEVSQEQLASLKEQLAKVTEKISTNSDHLKTKDSTLQEKEDSLKARRQSCGDANAIVAVLSCVAAVRSP